MPIKTYTKFLYSNSQFDNVFIRYDTNYIALALALAWMDRDLHLAWDRLPYMEDPLHRKVQRHLSGLLATVCYDWVTCVGWVTMGCVWFC